MSLSKTLIAISLSSVIFTATSNAADGNINFTGEIVSNPCTVVGDTGANVNVALGKVSTSAFAQPGDTAAPTQFGIKLTNCSDVTSAQVKFDGTADNTNKSLIKLSTAADAATGVAVGLYEADGSTILPLFNPSAPITITDKAAQFNFIAKYVATAAEVKAGPANATATFSVIYK